MRGARVERYNGFEGLNGCVGCNRYEDTRV